VAVLADCSALIDQLTAEQKADLTVVFNNMVRRLSLRARAGVLRPLFCAAHVYACAALYGAGKRLRPYSRISLNSFAVSGHRPLRRHRHRRALSNG
jgi:hypothetical protein